MLRGITELEVSHGRVFFMYLLIVFGFLLLSWISLDESTRQDAAIELVEKYIK